MAENTLISITLCKIGMNVGALRSEYPFLAMFRHMEGWSWHKVPGSSDLNNPRPVGLASRGKPIRPSLRARARARALARHSPRAPLERGVGGCARKRATRWASGHGRV